MQLRKNRDRACMSGKCISGRKSRAPTFGSSAPDTRTWFQVSGFRFHYMLPTVFFESIEGRREYRSCLTTPKHLP